MAGVPIFEGSQAMPCKGKKIARTSPSLNLHNFLIISSLNRLIFKSKSVKIGENKKQPLPAAFSVFKG